jgi:hypothetical protein
MVNRDPEKNFEALWKTFHNRYPFFELRKVDWKRQYDIYGPMVTSETTDDELFDIFCQMLDPLDDGHVELRGKIRGDRKERYFNPEPKPRFWQEFTKREIKQLFKTTEKTLVVNGFGRPAETRAWMLHYCRSRSFAYIRILELEGIKKRRLTVALDRFPVTSRVWTASSSISEQSGWRRQYWHPIINQFCDRKRVAFREGRRSARATMISPP